MLDLYFDYDEPTIGFPFLPTHKTVSGLSKDLIITGSTAGAVTNYQVPVTVTYESEMETDFSDVTFGSTTGTPYDYWLEDKTDSVEATFWVEITSIPASPDTTTLRMTYGSTSTTESDGDATFQLFENFNGTFLDPAKWRKTLSGSFVGLIEDYTLMFTGSGGQGLASDENYLYHGADNGDGLDSSIYVTDYSGNPIAASPFTGPPHASGGDIREDNDTLLFGSGGGEDPVLWEINKTTGVRIRGWDFTGDTDFLNNAGMVAYKSENTVYIHASDTTDFRILEVTLNEDESVAGAMDATYTVVDYWTATKLGTAQGLDYVDGYLYYGYDVSLVHKVSSLELVGSSGGSISVINSKNISDGITGDEIEGLTFNGTNWYVGDEDGRIKRMNSFGYLESYAPTTADKTAITNSLLDFSPGTAMGIRCKSSGNYPMFGLANGTTHPSSGDDHLIFGRLSNTENYLKSRRKTGGTAIDKNYPSTTDYNNFNKYEIQWKSGGVEFFYDGTSLDSGFITDTIPSTTLKVALGGNTSTRTEGWTVDTDYLYVRKFVDPEPTTGAWT